MSAPVNVPLSAPSFTLPVPVSAAFRESPREDEELAALWGCTPKAAHTLKIHAARRAADVIRLRRAKQDYDGAARYAAPLEEVMAAMPCPEPEKREGVTDGMEDVAQATYRADRTKANLQALLRARASERQASLDLDRELIANAPKEWEVSL